MGGLSVSDLVQVTVNITAAGAQALGFGTLMIAGDTNVINGLQRVAGPFSNIDQVTALGFGTTDPEFLAAEKFFSQVPSPTSLMLGRWISAATKGENIGKLLTAAQQVLSNWTVVSNGGLDITIDGTAHNLTALDFTAVTNLNGVATVITTALSGAGTCVWTGTCFEIISATTGAGVAASATITLSANPSNLDTVTLNGTVITFVSGTPSGSQVKIGASKEATMANLQVFLQASTDTQLVKCTYSTTLAVTTITYGVVGTVGNAFTLTKSGANIAVSGGGTLTGGVQPSTVGYATAGAGTDISAQLGLTSATAQALVPGYNAETPVACATALAAASPLWYGLMFASTVTITDNQNLAVSDYIEATGSGIARIFGVTTQDTAALSSLSTSDLAYLMGQAGYNRSLIQYSSTSPYAIASLLGRAFTVDFEANNTTINLMYKQEPAVTAETLTESQALVLKTKNCNVFVNYVNDTTLIQYGVMSSGMFIDTIQGCDWVQNAIQTAVFNVMYTTSTKIPQTDAGVNQITNAIAGVCNQAVANGLVAGGTWNASGFGSLQQGQYLKTGYYIYATPLALQSEADRAARKAPPIQVALKLAGAIQTVDVLVSVNQ